MRHLALSLTLAFLTFACSSDDTDDGGAIADAAGDTIGAEAGGQDAAGEADGGSAPVIGEDIRVYPFEAAHVFFSGWDEGQNARELRSTVTLPPLDQSYASVRLNFALSCPDRRCDPWDRLGSIGIVLGEGDDEQYVELSRFITPYGVGATWSVDVTDLRPLLAGEVTFRVFIDTWVGPGGPYGKGWSVDAGLEFGGGIPERRAIAAVPVIGMRGIVYGDPARPITEQLEAFDVAVPEGASSLALRTFITGHGQGNAENCAEFCPRDHTFTLDGEDAIAEIWRDDCETTAPDDQQGTWQYPRAGWCPGTESHPWVIDVDVPDDGTLTVGYDVEAYENTCRPDAPECAGCTLGNGCEWNDSNHTEPRYEVSALLIAYE